MGCALMDFLKSLQEFLSSREELEGVVLNERFEGFRLADRVTEIPLYHEHTIQNERKEGE